MEPTNDFWAGVAKSVASSTGDWVVGIIAVICLAAIFAKYVVPVWRDKNASELELEKRRLELEVKSQADEDERTRERIRLTEKQLDVQSDQTRAIEALTAQTNALNAAIDTSRANSSQMGDAVRAIDAKASRIESGVGEIKDMVSRIGGTD